MNWNAEKYIQNCINSIINQTYDNIEIILVDNASTDNSIKLVEQNFPNVQIIKNSTNLGFAQGNNIGIKNSKGNIIALINPDAVIEKNWLECLLQILESSQEIAGATGKIYYLNDNLEKNSVFCTWSRIDPFSAAPTNFFNDEQTSKVDYLSGAAMLVKKSAIAEIGLLDTEYFMYFEETDLCARMIRAGYDLVYTPDAIAWHAVSALSESSKKIYFMERNKIRFALKNFDLSYIFPFLIINLGESLFIFFRDVKNKNFSRTKIRWKAIFWNLVNISNTIKSRKQSFCTLRKIGLRSYNRSLPLRNFKP